MGNHGVRIFFRHIFFPTLIAETTQDTNCLS